MTFVLVPTEGTAGTGETMKLKTAKTRIATSTVESAFCGGHLLLLVFVIPILFIMVSHLFCFQANHTLHNQQHQVKHVT